MRLTYIEVGGSWSFAIYRDKKLWLTSPTHWVLLSELASLPYTSPAVERVRVPAMAWSSMGETFPDTLDELEGYL